MHALREILVRAEGAGAAIGHFNVADLVLLKAVFVAAREVKVPVLVGASEGERAFFGIGTGSAIHDHAPDLLVASRLRTMRGDSSSPRASISWLRQWATCTACSKAWFAATPGSVWTSTESEASRRRREFS